LVNHNAKKSNCRLSLSNPRGRPRRWVLKATKNICFCCPGQGH
jgi:hypothetical protein